MNQVFTLSAGLHGTPSSSSSQSSQPSVRFKWQPVSSTYLASVGTNHVVHITDRHGTEVDSFPLAGRCLDLAWTPDDGELLAAVGEGGSAIATWDAVARRAGSIESGMKGLNVMAWNLSGDVLAIGTAKGNLLLYNRRTSKKTPVMGKHSKAIVCMAWSKEDVLACGSLDFTFSLSNLSGDTVFQMGLKGEPSNMQWSTMKSTPPSDPSPVLSIVLSSKTLFFHNLSTPESPIELAFQSKYGNIASYAWFGDGLVMLGFSAGHLVVVSTSMNEIGQEMFQNRNHKDALAGVAVCAAAGKAATCGDGSVRVHELADLKDVYAILDLEDERGALESVGWSEDGGFLTVGSRSGNVYTFLSRLPILGAAHGAISAHLTGISEISVTTHDRDLGKSFSIRKDLGIEPSAVGVGPYHWAAAVNDRATFFYGGWPRRPQKWGKIKPNEPVGKTGEIVMERDYIGTVAAISISDRLAAVQLTDGRVQVHPIDAKPTTTQNSQRMFPEKDVMSKLGEDASRIVSSHITNELFIYAMAGGVIHHYTTENWTLVNEYKHKKGITALFPQPGTTKLVFRDDVSDFFIYDPVRDGTFAIPNISAKSVAAVWEANGVPGKALFVTYDDAFITTHAFHSYTIKGPQCLTLGTTKLPYGFRPLIFADGAVLCQTPSGKIMNVALSTHEPLANKNLLSLTEQAQGKALQLCYTLGIMKEIWSMIDIIKSRKAWTMLAEAALFVLDIATAKRVYRQILHDAGMVTTLTSYEQHEEISVLAGYICIIFREFEQAQDLFLRSSEPVHALFLRRDLMQWDQALQLASKLAPREVTVIAREHAAQLEAAEKFAEALAMYETALASSNDHAGSVAEKDEHQIVCSAGITRNTFRMGDVTRGMRMLNGVEDTKLLLDCAAILEGLKLFAEGGALYERASAWERAAEAYIKGKNWAKVGNLLEKIQSPKIFSQYAKAKEAIGQFAEASDAYEKAQDFDNVVRLCVEHLGDIEKAVRLVRETRSRESARIISKFFQARHEYKSVIEFCLMAGMSDEAFELAQQHDVMEHFAELVKREASPQLLNNISTYFENKRQLLQAGKYTMLAGDYAKALRLFMRCPVLDGESIEKAIEAVGLAKNDALTHELIDYLMGESDGVPKEAKYIFKLYMSLGSFRDAARTAIIIAREEQTLGNYRAAHDLLLDNYRQLKRNKAPVPSDLDRMLMILHSYILVKTLIKINEHEKGARMLIRVASNISRFPAHVVPILTSTVIECYRAGMKKEAFEYAAMLMRPEYRPLLDAKYKRKIEQIIRRPEKEETVEEKKSPCPYCGNQLAETILDCIDCKNHIPYCIASGKHMTLENWSCCPNCDFPALLPEFKNLVSQTNSCPMCCVKLAPEGIRLIDNPRELLRGSKEGDNDGKMAVPAATAQQSRSLADLDALGASLSALESTAAFGNPGASARAGAASGSGVGGEDVLPALGMGLKDGFPGGVFGTAPGKSQKDPMANFEPTVYKNSNSLGFMSR
ncbi:WD repeat-containing protein 19 [Phlyctochytrium bullatum]|nr:WD repeat-containing protein 19 [Phlyctochytrium bullatum]